MLADLHAPDKVTLMRPVPHVTSSRTMSTRSFYSAIPLPNIQPMISILGPGNWLSGASLERSVHLVPELERMPTHIFSMVILVILTYRRYRVKARNPDLWTANFSMNLQVLQHVLSPKVQRGGYKVSLALFCTLTTFQLRTMELLSQRRVYKSAP